MGKGDGMKEDQTIRPLQRLWTSVREIKKEGHMGISVYRMQESQKAIEDDRRNYIASHLDSSNPSGLSVSSSSSISSSDPPVPDLLLRLGLRLFRLANVSPTLF